ncbi:glycosyltransferase family 2 protein [Sphingomonas sp.]|uniref:glycosyltransferase family 2 protein n=1 Tax=Sphingomonas sp. TaxID=28214 RepID=UPI003AFFCE45
MASTIIVLVNWNGWRDTVECLESLLRLDDEKFAVVIVDNGSADGSADAIAAWAAAPAPERPDALAWAALPATRRTAPTFRRIGPDATLGDERVTLVEAGVNLGFAGACNLGMRLALGRAATRFVWLLNNDTIVRPDALSRLVGHMAAHPDHAIVGATLLYYHAPATVQGLAGWLRPSRALAGHVGFGGAADALPQAARVEAEMAYVMGASMFVRRVCIEATGGMSEEYFLYYEEPDWARRLPAGMRQGVCLDAVVWHKEGGSIGTSSLSRPSDTSLYYYARGTLRFYWKHQRRYAGVALGRILYDGVRYVAKGDGRAAAVTARVLVDAVSGRRRRGPYGSAEFNASS